MNRRAIHCLLALLPLACADADDPRPAAVAADPADTAATAGTTDADADDGTTAPMDPCPGCDCIEGDVRPCELGFATCAASETCVDGAWSECRAHDGELEICNDKDDDCDGVINNGLIGCGGCELGLAEICNGIDDDCNGLIDDGIDCACIPSEERCNFIDDNCNGLVDEGVTNVCGGCGPIPDEVCNGKDDDCNGLVDDGVTNACGTCGALPVEVCNGVDDDCDGLVDEHLINACGTCGPPPIELCNGVDDDCDGDIDEDAPDCGFELVWKPFVLVDEALVKLELPLPAKSQIVPLVLVDEYQTGGRDYLFYAAACKPSGDHLTCDLAAGAEGGGTKIRGRVVLLGIGADGEAQSLAPFKVAQGDNAKLLGKLTVAGGHPLLGTVLYDHGGDKDFGFALTAQAGGGSATFRGSGFYGNAGSMVAGYAHLVRFPAGVKVHAVAPTTVYNGKPVTISLHDVGDPAAVVPLLNATTYHTAADDDASWKIQCGPVGSDFKCVVSVEGGNDGSHVVVQGVLLGG